MPIDWDASFVLLGVLRTTRGAARASRRLLLREELDGSWSLTVRRPQCTVEVCLRGDAASLACDLLATLQEAVFAREVLATLASDTDEDEW